MAQEFIGLGNTNTIKCLSIGTPKNNKIFICSKGKIIFRCPKIWAHYSLITMCSIIGTPKTINFPFGTNGKLMVLGVPILALAQDLNGLGNTNEYRDT